MGICNTGHLVHTLDGAMSISSRLPIPTENRLLSMGIGSMVVSGQFIRQYSPVDTFGVANHMPMPVKRKEKKIYEVHQV